MKNFEIEHEGKKYWISRSMAAVVYVFAFIGKEVYVLANKRGPGLPTNVGKWNCPSGYLDFDETLEECAVREVFEETGYKITKKNKKLELIEIDSQPTRKGMQNVLVRYTVGTAFKTLDDAYKGITSEHSEPNEVDDIKWISLKDLDSYEWVSEKHKQKILAAYETYIPYF